VIDFGMARFYGPNDLWAWSDQERYLQTANYRAPEVTVQAVQLYPATLIATSQPKAAQGRFFRVQNQHHTWSVFKQIGASRSSVENHW